MLMVLSHHLLSSHSSRDERRTASDAVSTISSVLMVLSHHLLSSHSSRDERRTASNTVSTISSVSAMDFRQTFVIGASWEKDEMIRI